MIDDSPPLWDELIRSERRTLSITVRPDRSVLVRAPLDAPQEKIIARVRKRERWIKRQIAFFEQFVPRTGERRFVSGEGHLYLGRRYRLKVIGGEKTGVRLWAGYIEVRVKNPMDPAEVARRLWSWYRVQAARVFDEVLQLCLARRPDILAVNRLEIRRMAKRWGSCTREGLITLNLDLIRAQRACIEYVIVHELCHLLEQRHSTKFFRLLGSWLPDWEERKRILERALV